MRSLAKLPVYKQPMSLCTGSIFKAALQEPDRTRQPFDDGACIPVIGFIRQVYDMESYSLLL
ncbi:hypothetical protein DWX17_01670 [[Clostridium] innocuum]|nr:hypothetical protein DWX17_01670 [[Clostridium] innocuum]